MECQLLIAKSISIHNPHGEFKEVTREDKCELADGRIVEVTGFREDGRINFRQNDKFIYQGHFSEIVRKCDQSMNDPIQKSLSESRLTVHSEIMSDKPYVYYEEDSSIKIYTPKGVSVYIHRGDKCQLNDSKEATVGNIHSNGMIDFQLDNNLHCKFHCSQIQLKCDDIDDDMATAITQSIASAESDTISRTDRLLHSQETYAGHHTDLYTSVQQTEPGKKIVNHPKDNERNSELDGSKSATIIPEETQSLSSIDSDEVNKTTFDRMPLVIASHKAEAFLPSTEHSFHQNLLPLKTSPTNTFPPSFLRIPDDKSHIIPGIKRTFQVTLTHTDDQSITQLMNYWLASISTALQIPGQGSISLIAQSSNQKDLEWTHDNNLHVLDESNCHEYVVYPNQGSEDTVVVFEVRCNRNLQKFDDVDPMDGVEEVRQQYYSKMNIWHMEAHFNLISHGEHNAIILLGGSCIFQSPHKIKHQIIDGLKSNGFTWADASTRDTEQADAQVQIIAKTWQEGETDSVSYAIALMEDLENYNDLAHAIVTLPSTTRPQHCQTSCFTFSDMRESTHPKE